MTVPFDKILLTVGIGALVAWRLYARIRRVIGRQRLSTLRPWLTVTLFPLLAVLVLLGSMADPVAGSRVAAGLAAGIAVGVALGLYGTRLTKFEATPAGLFYTPNAHLGIALSLLLVLRIGYRILTIWLSGQALDAQSLQMHTSPLTLALFGTLAGYYVTYAIGLLRWRRSVSRDA
jgi:hypothetical protein